MSKFSRIITALERPDMQVLEMALNERQHLPKHESNYITYLACFTHYDFALELLKQFGIYSLPETKIPVFSMNSTVHFTFSCC